MFKKMLQKIKQWLHMVKIYIQDYWFWMKLLHELQVKNDNWYIFCPYGIGDTYLVCALSYHFLNFNGGKKIVYLLKKEHSSIANLFPKDRMIFLTIDNIYFNCIKRYGVFKIAHPFVAHPEFLKPDFVDYLGANNITLLDIYKNIFNISINCDLLTPKIDNSIVEKSKKIFNDLCLPYGRTVILAPDAKSVNTVSIEFWIKLAKKLNDMGLAVCTNCPQSSLNCIPETIAISFSLDEAICIAEMAGWVIASRSGLCDLISSANCKLTVIYLKQKWHSGTAFTSSSLRMMGLSDKVLEYEFDVNNTVDYMIQSII